MAGHLVGTGEEARALHGHCLVGVLQCMWHLYDIVLPCPRADVPVREARRHDQEVLSPGMSGEDAEGAKVNVTQGALGAC